VALTALTLVGCGGSGEAPPPQPPDGDEKIERQIDALRRDIRRQHATEPAVAPIPGFERFARSLDGEVGASLGVPGASGIQASGALEPGVAWSTIKVPLALRVLDEAGGPGALGAEQREQIAQALVDSDNDAAMALFDGLASAHGGAEGAATAVTEVLREAGDEKTRVSAVGRGGFSPYGQTAWSLPAQHRFMSALAAGCVGTAAEREHLLGLMGRVRSDTWGLGSAGVPARWKGGWGPDPDGRYLVRQMGLLEIGGEQAVVTLAVRPADGRFESGQAIATELAQWLATRPRPAAGPGC
jgi:hypothetical protein